MPRRIAIVTTGRADYHILAPVARAAGGDPRLEPAVFPCGAHLSERHGLTVRAIEADGFDIPDRVHTEADAPGHTMADAMARGVAGFAHAFRAWRPDAALLLGDRFETVAAALAAASTGTPIAHLHGGEISEGAIDNQFRYAISALAGLHLTATELSRQRLIAMGECPEAVVRTGAPGLDALAAFNAMPRDEFARAAGLATGDPFLLVTLHPTTLGRDAGTPGDQARSLLAALDAVAMPCLITSANQDPGGEEINAVLGPACEARGWPFHAALGPLYHHAMAHAGAMVGNSSSGIIEAASLGLPVVNIGDRQLGRERAENVVDCGHGAEETAGTIRRALEMRGRSFANPYGDGRAIPRIVDALAGSPLALRKRFTPPGL